MIAALYIDPLGPYPKMPGVECWGLPERDAKLYSGPWPVVAHPPCGPWGRLRHLCKQQDSTCALRAVDQVREFGGVLEHPAHSALWEHCSLPKPLAEGDEYGFTIQVEQVNWGHPARKTTWLYCCGVDRAFAVAGIQYGREPTHWVSGRRSTQRGTELARAKGWKGGAAPPGIKFCSAQQRRRTPPDFARYLVKLAASVNRQSGESGER